MQPALYTPRIRERLEHSRTEQTRHVSMNCTLPSSGSIEHAGLMLVPILTPDKGRLATVHNCHDAEGSNLRQLAHDQHAAITKAMISHYLWGSCLAWIDMDPDYVRGQIERDIEPRLRAIVDLEPADAQRRITNLFQVDGPTKGRLIANPFEYELSPEEQRLFALCEMLAAHNVLVLEVDVPPGEIATVRYTYNVPVTNEHTTIRDFIVEQLGGQASNVRVDVPLARCTDDYHFYMAAPPTHFIAQQEAFYKRRSKRRSKRRHLRELVHMRGSWWGAQVQTQKGALQDAHVLIADGSRSARPINVGVVMYELPLGSIGSAWMASTVTTATLGLLLLARWAARGSGIGDTDVPALLALLAGGIAASSTLFARGEPSSGAVLAKVAQVCCSVLGIAFAVWWLYAASGTTKGAIATSVNTYPEGVRSSWLLRHGGALTFVFTSALLLIVTVRALQVVSTFRRVRAGTFKAQT